MTDTTTVKPGLFQSIADALRRYQKRRARRAEFAALGASESERVAHDIGLTTADLVALSGRDEDSAYLMERRLEAAGIAIKSIGPVVLRDMQRCCSQCENKQLCAHELEDMPKAAAWPRYCPNEQTMAALSAMKGH